MKSKTNEDCYDISSQKIFYSDLNCADINYAVLIRSPISSGSVISVSHPELPEGYKLILPSDIPGKNEFIANNIKMPILADKKISYIGQTIAILTGPNFSVLQDLKNEIEIQTESLEQETTEPINYIATRQINYGESEISYLQSALQLERSYKSVIQLSKPKEVLGAFCKNEKKKLKIYCPTNWAFQLGKTLESALNISKKDFSIVKTIANSATSNRVYFTNLLSVQATLSSFLTGKNTKLVISHDEMEEFIEKPIEVYSVYQVALEEGGTIRALNLDIQVDCGAFCAFAQEIIDHIVIAVSGIYKYKNYCITAFAKTSDKVPLSADLQLTDFLAFFSIENLMQDISFFMHLEPNLVRNNNLSLQKKDNSYPILTANNELKSTIDECIKNSDFMRKYISYSLTASKKDSKFPLKGIGLSCAFEGNGFFGESVNKSNVSMQVTLEIDKSVNIVALKPSDAILEIWKQIVCEELDVEKSKVRLVEPKNENDNHLPNIFTENISIMSVLIRKCCKQIKKQEFRVPLPITVKKDFLSGKNKKWNAKEFCGEPFYNCSWITSVAEIEIDKNTFEYNILSIWITINAGLILNPKNATESIKKAVNFILEQISPDINFSNAKINVDFIESKDDSKEIGNLVYNSLPAAITSALTVALQKEVSVLPIAADTIYYSLKKDDVVNYEN